MRPGTDEQPRGLRRVPLWVCAAAAAVVALAAGIPVGLSVAGNHGIVATTATPTTTPASDPSPRQPASPPSRPTGPPSGLDSAQAALWSSLRMSGVDRDACRSYPLGESDVPGVVASISCPIQGDSFDQPIWFRKFADAASMDGYMAMRANQITTGRGSCASGQEADTRWRTDGVSRGRIVCLYEPAGGVNYYKIAWASDATDTVAIIKNAQPAAVWNWWHAYCSQFGSG